MKTIGLALELQAYVDGELDVRRRGEVEKLLAVDADARAMVAELRELQELVRANEPVAMVPETREFYWSQVQRRIASAERRDERTGGQASTGSIQWLRWLVPAFGVAAVAVVLVVPRSSAGRMGVASNFADLGDPVSLTFHSDTDGITIHWIN